MVGGGTLFDTEPNKDTTQRTQFPGLLDSVVSLAPDTASSVIIQQLQTVNTAGGCCK